MKTTITKYDAEKIFHGVQPDAPKIKIKNDGSLSIINALYLHFMKTLAEETDKLLYMDGVQTVKERHVKAAGKQCLRKFSYRCLVRENLPSTSEAIQSEMTSDDISNGD